MREWELLDHETVPEDDATVYLMERGGQYAIHVDGRELMATGLHGSEDALADLAFDRLAVTGPVRVLVGGLGLGFTLAAVLRRLDDAGRVTVAELLPSVVRWNREYPRLARFAGRPLNDPRAGVHIGDVADLVEVPPMPWSAILLDIDNGPRSLTRPANGWLYTPAGARAAFEALTPGGVLAIWSAHPDNALTALLAETGFAVAMVPYTEEGRPTWD
ncbi:MAG: hypothetical protein AAF602_28045, partial [Myxococcota bacterium]